MTAIRFLTDLRTVAQAHSAPTAADMNAPDVPGRSWRWVLVPLGVFAVSRAAIALGVILTLRLRPGLFNEPDLATGQPLVDGLIRWDGAWFARIAEQGYREPQWTNFFPLFPLLGRLAHEFTGLSVPVALLLWSNLFGLVALLAIYRLFEELEGEQVARVALCLFAAWPFAFFQAAAYPESLMIAATAVAICLAMRGRHLGAGVALGAGVLARHLSGLAWPSLLVLAMRRKGRGGRWTRILALLLPIAAVCAYFAFVAMRFGDPLAWLHARSEWGASAWWGAWSLLVDPSSRQPHQVAYVVLSLIPLAGAIALLARPRWRPLAPFALSLMAMLWLTGLAGMGRYSASCWPAFLPIAFVLARRPAVAWLAIAAFGALQLLFLHLFARLYPIL